MYRASIVFTGLSGALAVFLAASAAHGLAAWLAPEDLERISTAMRYQIWHALALLATALLAAKQPSTALRVAATGFMVGSVLFCGSLYLVSFTGQRSFGWLAPIGGLAFVTAWLSLAYHGWRGATPRSS